MTAFHPDSAMPGCMMPDGGECCEGYQALLADWRRYRTVDESFAKQLQLSIERNSRLVNRVKALESFCTNSAKHVTDGELFAGHVADVCRRIALDEVT